MSIFSPFLFFFFFSGFHFILLHAKSPAYKCRLAKRKLTFEAFINSSKHIYEVDKHVHLQEMASYKFMKKWTYNKLVPYI